MSKAPKLDTLLEADARDSSHLAYQDPCATVVMNLPSGRSISLMQRGLAWHVSEAAAIIASEEYKVEAVEALKELIELYGGKVP